MVGRDLEVAGGIAGIQAVKKTPDLIPLAHPVAVHGVSVDLTVVDEGVEIVATVRTADRTGIEMEALTAVSVAALTVIDMVKAGFSPALVEDNIRNSPASFDLTTRALIVLKENGVQESTIQLMLSTGRTGSDSGANSQAAPHPASPGAGTASPRQSRRCLTAHWS